MEKGFFSSLVLGSGAFILNLLGDTTTPPCSDQDAVYSKNITLRHIEAQGVGYNQGYTTLEAFATPTEAWKKKWIPFCDLRGHLFNNGKPAANLGIGVRYAASHRIWGLNTYYDYRKTTHQNYQQIGAGFESLGVIWDVRLNGYFPMGSTKSSVSNFKFDKFRNHYAYLSGKYEFAMRGANFEVGAHIDRIKHLPFYFAAGPYYLQGEGKTAWGGEARLTLDFLHYFRAEANTSYDHIFKWIGQGQLSLRIPFGQRPSLKEQPKHSCFSEFKLANRQVQRVDRNEIIATDHQRKHIRAVNPQTKKPQIFWFVNNTSHSQGTFESPFNTLADAQNASSTSDVIYVFPGDGTTKGMDQGITLKNHQKLWGGGIAQTLPTTHGAILIPAQTRGRPFITRQSDGVIVCSNNNEISGLSINVPIVHGIVCSDINQAFIHHNLLNVEGDAATPSSGIGLFLRNCSGNIIIQSNQFELLHVGPWGIQIASTAPGTNYFITNNTFHQVLDPEAPSAIELGLGSSNIAVENFGTIFIARNQFTNFVGFKTIGGRGLKGTGEFVLQQNIFSRCNNVFMNPAPVFLRIQPNSNVSVNITQNIWEDSPLPKRNSVYIQTIANTSNVCISLTENNSDITPVAYTLDNTAGASMSAYINHNIGNVEQLGLITPRTQPCP